jgi:CheY-like chemotaxis protein
MNAPSLLITDDDVAFRQTLQELFEPEGYRTLTAGDGEEALRIVHNERVDLVLIDMYMPKLSGLETLQRAKQLRALLPCILMSADLTDVLIEQARRAQVFSVLRKPVTRRQITGVVRQALAAAYNWH